MIFWLSRWYRRIGIHAAPPDTLFFLIDAFVRRVAQRRIFRFASGNAYHRSAYGGTPYYDIKAVRRQRPVGGLALIYFMGAGDYLMTTPLIEALRQAHPDLPIHAYASTSVDQVNSPLVLDLLRINPLIDRVTGYKGRPRSMWYDYDFGDALAMMPKDFLALPVLYEVEKTIYHRITSLLETFGLPVDLPIRQPIAYPATLSPAAAEILQIIRGKSADISPAGIVCTHFGARSSGYEYPHGSALARRLIDLGYLVVTFSNIDLEHRNIVSIDVSRLSPSDSIEILRALAVETPALFLISVNSIMWPISAALDIPNLGLHTFKDPSLHQYLYPNIFVVSQYKNNQIPPSQWFLAPESAYSLRKISGDTLFTDYAPGFVVDCFQSLVSKV